MPTLANPITSGSWAPPETHYYACQCAECAAAMVNVKVKVLDPADAPVSDVASAQAAALPYYTSALLYPQDWRWNADYAHGTAITVSYSFMSSNPGQYGGFRAFSESEKAAARDALAEWAAVCNISFREVASGGQIAFGNADVGGASGMTLWQGTSGRYSGWKTTHSDVYMSSTDSLSYGDGSFGYRALLHEVGHALGLKHTFDTSGNTLSGIEDTAQYSVMSYDNPPSTPNTQPHTAQLYDIAAVQYLYGANKATNAGDTVHRVSNTKTEVFTIWDGGGNDAIDAANHTRSVTIDLREGKFSSIGAGNNVAVAFGSVIEKAVGGAAADTIIGNNAANVILGGGGADVLTGGGGADSFCFESLAQCGDTITDFLSGTDRIQLDAQAFGLSSGILDTSRFLKLGSTYNGANGSGSAWSAGDAVLVFDSAGNLYWDGNGAASGYTKVAGIQGGGVTASDIVLAGDFTAPTPTPTPTPDPTPVPTNVTGTSGADTLSGAGGDITMAGGLGNDTYIVDSMGDKVIEYSLQGVDTIQSTLGYRLGTYTENLVLTGGNAVNGTGSAWHNQMTGNDANNVLSGMGGNDTIKGMGGNDVLVGGSGQDVLTGGTGADTFRYLAKGDVTWAKYNLTKGTLKGDTVTDFQSGTDKLWFDDVAFALAQGTTRDGVNFAKIGSAYNGTNAYGSDWLAGKASVIVDATGTVYYDPNGKGAGYYVVATAANVHASDIVIA
ncbi:MAG TPA: M10 family metallopeptidase [Candidatus Omnitrophota bacterium]|nr:M10 family metallopeptidase [Candidatus Omnitrophota bacterium]